MVVAVAITLFRSITMFCGIDNMMQNIPHIQYECGNIPHNNVSPTKLCYGELQGYHGVPWKYTIIISC